MITQFSHLVGNTHTISLIKKSVERGILPQFILLSGVHGTGKSTVAELIGMSLSCENLQQGEPCCSCSACRNNLEALSKKGAGISPYIEKINMAEVATKGTMLDTLKSTFKLLHTHDVHIKVFEEFHSLDVKDQRLLLEETSRLPEHTYVILTTTKESSILKEIVSRCLTFQFNRLNMGESNILIDRILLNSNIVFKKEEYKLIYKRTEGIPRNIDILVNHISQVEPSSEEMSVLLGYIDKKVFINILGQCKDFNIYISLVEELQTKYPCNTIIKQFIMFLTNLLFAIEGEIYDYFTKKEISKINLSSETVYNILRLLETCKEDIASLDLVFLKIRKLLAPPTQVSTQKLQAENSKSIQQSISPTQNSKEVEKTPRRFKGGC